MLKAILGFFLRVFTTVFLVAGLAVLLPRLVALVVTSAQVVSSDQLDAKPVAIVLGAGLQRDGTPSPVLRDRVSTAANLYFSKKVRKLLMSGDNRFLNYNEPGAMQAYAVQLGVPPEDIVLDYAGRRTYDTCYRARHIFLVEQAVIVTQKFHLPRALFICNVLGLKSSGVAADLRPYRAGWYYSLREFPATAVAFWEAFISHPVPVLGNPEPIFKIE